MIEDRVRENLLIIVDTLLTMMAIDGLLHLDNADYADKMYNYVHLLEMARNLLRNSEGEHKGRTPKILLLGDGKNNNDKSKV